MRNATAVFVVLLLGTAAAAQKPRTAAEMPTGFVIGVRTYFDFGPPSEHYSLYVVRSEGQGSQLERYLLTPEARKCFSPAKVERASATMRESVAELLEHRNPCEISEKDMKREEKRCKRCSSFSGEKVLMEVKCGESKRLIRSDILDRDMFDPHEKIPDNTRWTMRLLGKLEQASGPGVMDKPAFFTVEVRPDAIVEETPVMRAIGEREYDALFSGGELKFSAIYKQSRDAKSLQKHVTLTSTLSHSPEELILPDYPPIALLANAQGVGTAEFTVQSDGTTKVERYYMGNQLLNPAVERAVSQWKFPKEAAGEKMEVSFSFSFDCPE